MKPKLITKWPILYEKSKSDKIKIWYINVFNNKIFTQYGFENGKQQHSLKIIHTGKNIGRSNETTPQEQAIKEAGAKWKKQLDKGYVKDKQNLNNQSYYPMLAKTYVPGKTVLPKNTCIQPKLNGVRCVAVKTNRCVKLYSRNMKDYTPVLWDLAKQLSGWMSNGDIYDGELYKRKWPFERIISAVKKESFDTYSLEYHVFDIPSLKQPFEKRFDYLRRIVKFSDIPFSMVTTSNVRTITKQKIKVNNTMFVNLGFEGIIIRNADAKYLWKYRGKELLKYKDFKDEEFRIIGYKQGSGSNEGAITFKCHIGGTRNTGPDGYFDCRPVGTLEDRRAMYKRGWTYVGKMLTVRYQERSRKNVPIFPVGIVVRDYEN